MVLFYLRLFFSSIYICLTQNRMKDTAEFIQFKLGQYSNINMFSEHTRKHFFLFEKFLNRNMLVASVTWKLALSVSKY